MSSNKLPGFALITGAASGMGRATARAMIAAGVVGIALLDVNATGLKATAEQLPSLSPNSAAPAIRTVVCDITSPEAIEAAFEAAHSEFGRIDYSIHCAGVLNFGSSLDMTVKDFDFNTSILYRGVWLCQRSAIKIMQKQSLNCEAYPDLNIPEFRAQRGAIVNIASVLSHMTSRQIPIYASAKAAVLSLTKGDALDYASDRIRVNAVLPGMMDTPMLNQGPAMKEAVETTYMPRVPMQRFGQPEEIADVIVFLCGTGASFVTGSGWVADGGYMTT